MGTSGSKVKITPQDRAILDLKLQRDKLKQYQKRIEVVLEREREIAKESLRQGNKARALTALRQRKYQESLLSQTDGQLETLQKLVSSIEFSLVEKDVLFGLQQGNSVLKDLHKEMNLDAVEQLLSDTAEGIAYQKEIDEALSQKISLADEEDVQAELAALVAAQLPPAALPELPNVPVGEIHGEESSTAPVVKDAVAQRERPREAMLA